MDGPSKTQIAEYWVRRRPGVFSIDIGEPSCFACDWWRADWDGRPRPWEAARQLQRCHLVARKLGGLAVVENMVLLCAVCHREAPDHANPEWMIRWIRAREDWSLRMGRQIEAEVAAPLTRMGVSADAIARYLSEPRFADRIRRECAVQAGSLAMSTMAAVLAQHHLAVTAKPVQLKLFAA